MSTWPTDTLGRISASDDLHIAPFRPDGTTHGTLTWIWSVVVDNRLFVRPWNGPRSRWYQAALTQGAGRITAAGEGFDVTFTRIGDDEELNLAIDDAYRTKYTGSAYLPPMITAGPRSTTVEITPTSRPADAHVGVVPEGLPAATNNS